MPHVDPSCIGDVLDTSGGCTPYGPGDPGASRTFFTEYGSRDLDMSGPP